MRYIVSLSLRMYITHVTPNPRYIRYTKIYVTLVTLKEDKKG